mmetsp:Transcript_1669/g.2666  ORF Transcript_1669/g.2666 Transcript_1669/m.2666 type:complete len:579 (+) Transcript_1669:86-1822(+)
MKLPKPNKETKRSSSLTLSQRHMQEHPEIPVISNTSQFLRCLGVVQESGATTGTDNVDDPGTLETTTPTSSLVEPESVFESSFDLTEERLGYVFNTFDTDADGKISYENLRLGLKEWQELQGSDYDTNDDAFEELVKYLDSDSSGDITFREFSEGIRLMLLRALLPPQPISFDGTPLAILDYDAHKLVRTTIGDMPSSSSEIYQTTDCPPNHLSARDFYHKRRPEWVRTRWINVCAFDDIASAALTMKRLGVKYLLHPLALEDAIEIDTHRPKVEVFSSHYFLMIPVFSMASPQKNATSRRSSRTSTASGVNVRRRFWRWCRCRCNLLNSGDDSRPETKPISRIQVEIVSIFVNVPRNDTIITFLKSGETHRYWHRIQQELEKSYSKLRQYDAQYLTYSLLDRAVDLLIPIIKTMQHEIDREKEYAKRNNYDLKGLDRVREIREELEKVSRRLKPFASVLTHVIEDDAIVPGATIYIQDVRDNLEMAEDDLRHLISECHKIDSNADKHHSRQMDRTLYTLTIVSTIFLPAQFLTGVYGMNFHSMPELNYAWGYPTFWALTVTMTAVMVIALNFGRLRN